MKYFVLTLHFIGLFTGALTAQLTTGMVHYEETIQFDIELDGEASQYAHLIPSSQTNQFVLRFTPQMAHYAVSAEAAPPPPPQQEGEVTFQVKIVRSGDNSAVYTDLTTNKMVEQRSIFGRPFRIEHELDGGAWKLQPTEQKEILGYPCLKATTGPDTLQTTAWFTPQIPVATGPGIYSQLPGLILEVSWDNITITATEVLTELDDASLITPPTKGKKVTEEAFEAIQEMKMQEMNLQGGSRIEIRG